MAGGAPGRAAGGALLPRRVHAAAADRRHRLPEQGRDLRPAVQGERRDAADDRGRPEAARCQDRLHLGAAHLGLRHDPSSARAHDRAGRRHLARRIALDQQPSEDYLLPVPVLSRMFRGKMLAMLKAAHDAGRLQFFGAARRSRRQGRVQGLPRAALRHQVARLRQAAVRRTRAGAGLSRALHAPRRDLQQPADRRRPDRASRSSTRTTGSRGPAATRP